MSTDIDSDMSAWAAEQAALLRAGRLQDIDVVNLAEVIEAWGKTDSKAVRAALRTILENLAKQRYGAQRPASRVVIAKARLEIDEALANSPSLTTKLPDLNERAWKQARLVAKLSASQVLPERNPFPLDQVLDADFWS